MSDVIETRFAQMQELADQFAEAQSQADHLSEFRKSKKALLMKQADVDGHKTAAMQEREAYASADYVELLDGLRAATERALSLKWRLELFRMKFDWARTQSANKRAEMSLR